MSYTALYRKYRPSNFLNVVGQDMTVKILVNSIKSSHISHAYLFTGPRGTGKTSIAKIFARAVNCQNFTDDVCGECQSCNYLLNNDTDIIEIDAASNNGVDEIRTLRENVKLLPTLCKYKIYIIDEVHMLSTGAFNALLKTLEEPPSHVIFILATTEPNKIPVTILSRCQRFDFNKIDIKSLTERLNYILQNENKLLTPEVVEHIAYVSDGGLRDAINLLDQALSISDGNITIADIDKLSGKVSKDTIFNIFDYILNADYVNVLTLIESLTNEGKNYIDIVNYMLTILRDISVFAAENSYFDQNYSQKLAKYNFSSSLIVQLSKILNELVFEMKNANDQKLLFEIYVMHLTQVINNFKSETFNYPQKNSEKPKTFNNSLMSDVGDNKKEKEKMNDGRISIEEDSSLNNDFANKENYNLNDFNCDEVEAEDKLDEISDISKLKSIRINNVLAEADKGILKDALLNYERVNDYISNKTYNKLAALLIEGNIVVASPTYLLFAFDESSYVSVFDLNYKQIELFLSEIFDKQYKVVAISSLEWQKEREKFIYSKKNNISYVLLDENDVELKKSDNFSKLEDSALNIFGEDTVSVK